jgi:hypothetical protein
VILAVGIDHRPVLGPSDLRQPESSGDCQPQEKRVAP